ncbi:NUDIX hydrolase [Wenxinia marina]|uniref:ADP-ribose pyrophosphatase n=1 Tax=Wenxinia marina DSM 24838 TaxID=1123501 RepID=A0A0D0QGF6_9RHOB|nr:NUDIX hydrolase [Wenxinia marina]KIQ71357.1 ADP-ribose pyrophosphatase [Wenxinia marina DSM 24838]GGL81341.1 NUDIX domain-containing protein [Wenxinia marina]
MERKLEPAATSHNRAAFDGAKVALFVGERLVIMRRDDRPDIDYPGLLDFPGGGREGDETPLETVVRETREEVGLRLTEADMVWRRDFVSVSAPGWTVWFYVARLSASAEADIVLGDEGQGWELMTPHSFLSRSDAVPSLQHRLAVWLNGR